MSDVTQPKPSGTFFTLDQYQQILQLLSMTKNTKRAESHVQVAATNTDSLFMTFCSGHRRGEWLVDIRATHHITSNLDVLDSSKRILDSDTIKVDLPNGKTVDIPHIGSAFVVQSQSISNVLYLPNLKLNLLSVSKLTRKLQCKVGFFPDFCIFKDLSTGQVKGIGREEHYI